MRHGAAAVAAVSAFVQAKSNGRCLSIHTFVLATRLIRRGSRGACPGPVYTSGDTCLEYLQTFFSIAKGNRLSKKSLGLSLRLTAVGVCGIAVDFLDQNSDGGLILLLSIRRRQRQALQQRSGRRLRRIERAGPVGDHLAESPRGNLRAGLSVAPIGLSGDFFRASS